MNFRRYPLALVCALLLTGSVPQAATAQEGDPEPIVYASYFQCEPGMSARASEIIRDSWGPIAQAHIDAGHLTAWGSLTHHTGGEWSRAIYHVANDRAQLFETLDVMVAEWQQNDAEAAAEFGEACDEHEDYVWTYVHGSAPAAEVATQRPTAGMSVYWVCDEGRGALADLLSEKVFAPAWNEQVQAGLIDSWSWFGHFMGDKYRRLLVADGSSHADLMTARDNVIEWAGANEPGLTSEFSNVCNGHVDYLWNIEASSP